MRAKKLVISKTWNNAQRQCITLKGIKAFFIYNMLREGVPKSNGTWEKKNTSGSYIWSEG